MNTGSDAVRDRQQLADVISRDRDLYDVVSRHGVTEDDLLAALAALRREGRTLVDLWALIARVARQRTAPLAAVGG